MTERARMSAAGANPLVNGSGERPIWGAYVGGRWVGTAGRETFAVIEPATGQEICRVVDSDEQLVADAVADSRRAFGEWRALAPRERGRLLRLVAARIREHLDELADLEAREVGKPRRDALRFDLSFCSCRL